MNRIQMIVCGISIVGFVLIGQTTVLGQIESSDYHTIRGKLQNSYLQFQTKKKGRVAFLGGSITAMSGWRDSTCAYLQRKFPDTEFEFIAAGIPSMGSTPGAFRLERDILSKGKVDLLFEEAAVNDPTNGRSTTEQIRGMEGIIRHARASNPDIDIVTMYFVDPDKMKTYNQGKVPEVIQNHDKVAEHYGVSSINLAKEVTDRINAGEFTWKDDFKDLHPAPFGQMVYYNSIKALLEAVWQNPSGKSIKNPWPEKIDQFSYDHGQLIGIENSSIVHGWEIDPSWQPVQGEKTRAGYVDVPMLVADSPGAELTFSFGGKAVGIAVAAGPDAGTIEYSIDGSAYRKLDLYTNWSKNLHIPWYYVLDAELNDEKHQISIRISEDKNPDSKGHACRIKTFFINSY